MSEAAAPAISAIAGGLALRGSVSAANVQGLRRQGESLMAGMAGGQALTIDLSGLLSASSVLLSLLLCWGRYASSLGQDVSFEGASADLRELAQLNGVADLLQL